MISPFPLYFLSFLCSSLILDILRYSYRGRTVPCTCTPTLSHPLLRVPVPAWRFGPLIRAVPRPAASNRAAGVRWMRRPWVHRYLLISRVIDHPRSRLIVESIASEMQTTFNPTCWAWHLIESETASQGCSRAVVTPTVGQSEI